MSIFVGPLAFGVVTAALVSLAARGFTSQPDITDVVNWAPGDVMTVGVLRRLAAKRLTNVTSGVVCPVFNQALGIDGSLDPIKLGSMRPNDAPGEGVSGLTAITRQAVVSTTDAVYFAIQQRIFSGGFSVDERLRQDELARSLGVSRQPVREALRQLESEGLVVRQSDRGYVIRRPTDEDVKNTYYLRWILESEAAFLAALNRTETNIKQLRETNEKFAAALAEEDWHAVLQHNSRFHRLIREQSGIKPLATLVDNLWGGVTVHMPVLSQVRGPRSAVEHDEIIRAIDAGDGLIARKAMRAHILGAAKDYYQDQSGQHRESLNAVTLMQLSEVDEPTASSGAGDSRER
jgi:DNA-binding GntR family transcriptional regulator